MKCTRTTTWNAVRVALTLSAVLVTLPVSPSSAGSCPSVCACKWKGGKQTVECLERALITIPDSIDSETQVLDMSGNNLQILPRETFHKANLTNLQKVFLKSCRIGQIGDRAFRGLTNLVELDLSHNLLTAIPSATFEDTPFLRYLSLADNPIQKIEPNAFRMVAGMAKIDLSHCEIQVVAPNAFEKLESLEWLKLNGNRLTELHPRTVDTISKLHGVDLHDNPWTCDCKLRAVKEWLSRNNIPYPVAPVCRSPERVAGRTFTELSVDDFACRPEILPASRYVEATTGENATVICRVGAVPSADVHWYWNGRLLLNNSAFSAYQKIYVFEDGKFEKTSTLVLTNALETDSSEFYCVAENRAGTAEANFTLHVSLRTAGMASLGSGQIAGLSAALVVLILAILMIALLLLVRLRRLPFSESKTPGRLEVIATMNGNGVTTTTTSTSPSTAASTAVMTTKPVQRITQNHFEGKDLQATNPVRKPPRTGESVAPVPYEDAVGRIVPSPSSNNSPGNNPDIIRDAKPDVRGLPPPEYSQSDNNERLRQGACNSLYSPATWEYSSEAYLNQVQFDASDRTPIIGEEDDDRRAFAGVNLNNYPPDYGLPISGQAPGRPDESVPDSRSSHVSLPPQQHPDAKTVRVWQRGVPVLPPATALKRVLAHSRNSPDEGYQEGCGTDV